MIGSAGPIAVRPGSERVAETPSFLPPVDASGAMAKLDGLTAIQKSRHIADNEMKLGTAFKAFFKVLFDDQLAGQVTRLLDGQPLDGDSKGKLEAAPSDQPAPKQPADAAPSRDPAVNVLAALQREARLVDLVNEDLSQYSDAQVGAAARPCLQQCASVLKRLFDLQPVVPGAEGETIDVDANASPMRYQWIGEGTADSGKLVHHGWQAARVELPEWSGDDADANVVAPAQVQAL